MARLPNPGGDNGNWGVILNDYLEQVHKPNGTLKDNSVTANVLAPNSVTGAALASDSVNAATIADGSVTETLLTDVVQEKLTKAVAADTTLQGKIYHDFTKDANGSVPSRADSGQPFVFTGDVPTIQNGKVLDPSTANAQTASYIQVDSGASITFAKATIEIDDSGSTNGSSWGLIAMSDKMGVVGPLGGAHVVFTATDVQWGVVDGGNNFVLIGSSIYAGPSIAGEGPKHVEMAIDHANSVGYARDPYGKVHRFHDSRIGSGGTRWLWFEPFYSNASTDNRLFGYSVAADTSDFRGSEGVFVSKARMLEHDYLMQNQLQRKVATGAAGYHAAPIVYGTVEFTSLQITDIIAPESGKIVTTVNVRLVVPSAGQVFMYASMSTNGTPAVAYELVVDNTVPAGEYRISWNAYFAGLTPGANYTFTTGMVCEKTDSYVIINPASHIHATAIVEPVS